MKKHFIINCILLCGLIFPVFSSAQNLQVGLDYGTSIFNWYNYRSIYFSGISIYHYDMYMPKVISGSVSYQTPLGIILRGKAGYGRAASDIEYDRPKKTFDYNGSTIEILKENEKIETNVNGFSIEAAALYPIAIDNAQKFLVYPGIGIGYYYYKYSGEWEYTDENSSYTEKGSGNFEESVLSGIGQIFILGIEVKALERVSFFLEFSKLGFSMLTAKEDLDFVIYEESSNHVYTEELRENIGTVEIDYNSSSGFNDIAVQFGVKFGL
jgi:hypothetical protein